MLITLFIMSLIGIGAGIFSSIWNYDTDKEIKEIGKRIDETNKWIKNQYREITKRNNEEVEKPAKEDKK